MIPSNGRQKDGRFAKGWKGGGRKALPQEIKEMCEAHSPKAVKLLCATMNDPEAKTELRIKCAEIILDRAYGKPRQSVDVETESIPQVIFMGADQIPD